MDEQKIGLSCFEKTRFAVWQKIKEVILYVKGILSTVESTARIGRMFEAGPVLRAFSFTALLLLPSLDCRLGRRKSRDGYAERRAAHVGQAGLIAEIDGGRIASLLSADADLEVGTRGTALFDGHLDEQPDAVPVDGLERIGGKKLLVEVFVHESPYIVAAEAECHLREVVGAEGEEFARIRHPVGEQRGAGDFDHRAVLVIQLGKSELLEDLGVDAVRDLFSELDF